MGPVETTKLAFPMFDREALFARQHQGIRTCSFPVPRSIGVQFLIVTLFCNKFPFEYSLKWHVFAAVPMIPA